jgi:hypothetical protein
MSMKSFGLDHRLAVESESALAAMFGRLFSRWLVEDALRRPLRCGEDEQLPVGEDTVNVEKKEFDLASAGLG